MYTFLQNHALYWELTTHSTPSHQISHIDICTHKYVKLCFSFAILGSAIPSIYQDFTYGHQGTWTHYGMGLVGILYFIESLLWTLDLWKSNSEQN